MRRNEGKQPIDPAGISAMDLPRTRFQFVRRTPSPDVIVLLCELIGPVLCADNAATGWKEQTLFR
jgi:hypothetical protein